MKIEKGEKYTIPKGFIKLSLNPTSTGRLYRHGLPFLLNQLFYANHPNQPENIKECATSIKQWSATIIKNSGLVKGLNLEDEKEAEKALEILSKHNLSHDWRALEMGGYVDILVEAIEENDPQKAAWAGYMLGTSRGLTIVTEPLFENTLWQGYLANQVVYEAAAATMHTPGEAEAIRKLEPIFRRLDEATLHTWVESGLPIGPRIGVKNLPEQILLPLAKWHLASLQKKKEQDLKSKSEKRAEWELKIKWLAVGISATGLILGAIKVFSDL
jgi:hypothetical protein